jgi:hypothetical protein
MYKLINKPNTNEANSVQRISDNTFIPFDPANTDYQAFLKYQAEGGKVYGADEEVPNGQAAE